MKTRFPLKIHYTQRGLLLALYLAMVWLASASFGFLFFVDSNTYINRIAGAPVLDQVVQFFPVSTMILGVINLVIVHKIHARHGLNVFVLFLLFPYNLLLLTNLTKESIIFVSMFLLFYTVKKRALVGRMAQFLLAAVLSLPRPTYLVLFLGKISPKILIPLFFLSLLALETLGAPDLLQEVFQRMEGRQYVHHVGRSFFVGLCVEQKESIYEFSKCWIPVFLGAPLHSDTISINVIPYFAFQLPYIFLVYKLLKSKKPDLHSLAVITIFGHFLFMIIAPTFGAFIRYAHPFVWAMGFTLLRERALYSEKREDSHAHSARS